MPEPSSCAQPSQALPPASNVAPIRCRVPRRQPSETPAHARALPIWAGARRLSPSHPPQSRPRLSMLSCLKLNPIPLARATPIPPIAADGRTSGIVGCTVVCRDLETPPATRHAQLHPPQRGHSKSSIQNQKFPSLARASQEIRFSGMGRVGNCSTESAAVSRICRSASVKLFRAG
jgi:hypothetical protein